jgi:predicted CopG family antitoxin
MKTMTIRSIPDDVYETLKSLAQAEHRSLQEQILNVIEREANLIRGTSLHRALQWRRKLARRRCGDIVEDIRSERQR